MEILLESPESKEIITATWSETGLLQGRRTLLPMLGNCRRGLMKLSRERFGNNLVELGRGKQRLRDLGCRQPSQETHEEEIMLQRILENCENGRNYSESRGRG